MVPNAGFWWRFLASVIDSIILNVGLSILGGVMGVGIGFGASMSMGQEIENGIFAATMLVSIALNIVLTWLYYALMESSAMQATVGKLAVGVVVTDLNGNRISFARATGRHFAKILSAMILMIGYIMAAFTERKQGLHDLVAGTLVWKTRDPRLVRDEDDIFA